MFSVPGIALITGAGSGIGRATALAFARAGAAAVHLGDINPESLQVASVAVSSVATNPTFRTLTSHIDVTKEDQVVQMLKDTMKTFGRVDYAANIAGVSTTWSPTADLPSAEYDHVNNINTRGTFLCMREELRAMRSQEPVARIPGRPAVRGAITNMSSILGHITLGGYASYVASKHAVVGLTKAAAADHASDGIRVNAVCPGYVDTPLLGQDAGNSLEARKALADSVLQKRLGTPDEIADIVLFLTSERASFVTGSSFVADGGHIII
ncbi:short-chain dehydrogenase/reductase SDR [Mucidula mucida]|nr:short-chain dehydrogenase/reductase SDR [Mucidula mucida]